MQSDSPNSEQAIGAPAALGAFPLFHAAWLFAAGIAVAQVHYLRPSLVLVALALVAVLCGVAAFRAQRIAWLPLAVLWLLLGAWCAEMEPHPAPAPALAALSDGLLRTVEGTVVDAGPVRGEIEQNLDEPTAAQRPAQRIDLRVSSLEVVTDTEDTQTPVEGGVRLIVHWPQNPSGPSGQQLFQCGERIRAVVRLLPPEVYHDPGVWSREDFLVDQGITSTATVNIDRVDRLGKSQGLFLGCRLSGLQRATSARLLALPAAMRRLPALLRLSRCLSCAICSECYQCVDACLAKAIDHSQEARTLELNVGAIIASSGFDAFDPSRFDTYNYANHPNVLTALEFERFLSAGGPTTGHVVRPSELQREADIKACEKELESLRKQPGAENDDKIEKLGAKIAQLRKLQTHEPPRRIAWLQCVGSRNINQCDNGYCSGVCCMYAIKEAVIAREHAKGDLDAAIFFMDMRTYGKEFEQYYTRAKNDGVRFIRSRVHSVLPVAGSDNLQINYVTESGAMRVEVFDLVVLSVGLEPSADAPDIAAKVGFDLDNYRFAKTSSFAPVETSRSGVYVCGVLQGPKDIPLKRYGGFGSRRGCREQTGRG